jgi:hypothetical protein
MKVFSNLNVVGIPRKDGGEPVIYKFTMVCSHSEACKFYAELRLAIIDRKEAELTARRLIILNELEERGLSSDVDNYVFEHEDIFGDDELPW